MLNRVANLLIMASGFAGQRTVNIMKPDKKSMPAQRQYTLKNRILLSVLKFTVKFCILIYLVLIVWSVPEYRLLDLRISA